MKKIFIAIFCVGSVTAARSQVEMNIFGGPQATSARYLVMDKNQSTEMKYGFQLGMGLKMQWEGQLYFVPQAFYSLKGFKVKLDRLSYPPDSLAIDNDVRLHTFELAALLQYNFSPDAAHFFVRLGPSIDIQVYGKEKFNRSVGGPVDRKMKFGFADYGRFGANINLHFGYQMESGLAIYGQYGLGIGSIVNTDNGPRIVHRVGGISIAWPLNKK